MAGCAGCAPAETVAGPGGDVEPQRRASTALRSSLWQARVDQPGPPSALVTPPAPTMRCFGWSAPMNAGCNRSRHGPDSSRPIRCGRPTTPAASQSPPASRPPPTERYTTPFLSISGRSKAWSIQLARNSRRVMQSRGARWSAAAGRGTQRHPSPGAARRRRRARAGTPRSPCRPRPRPPAPRPPPPDGSRRAPRRRPPRPSRRVPESPTGRCRGRAPSTRTAPCSGPSKLTADTGRPLTACAHRAGPRGAEHRSVAGRARG